MASINVTYETPEAKHLCDAASRVAYLVLRREQPYVLFDGIPIQRGPFRLTGDWPWYGKRGKQFWHDKVVNLSDDAVRRLVVQTVFDA